MKKWISLLGILFFFLACNLFGPYNVFQDMNAGQIVEDEQLKREFITDPLQNADYKGNNTYLVTTASGKEFVVIQNYFSVMNYQWEIIQVCFSPILLLSKNSQEPDLFPNTKVLSLNGESSSFLSC
ncbi:MAG: hypothetical protein ACQEUT_09745 [Bacillota bacterium]